MVSDNEWCPVIDVVLYPPIRHNGSLDFVLENGHKVILFFIPILLFKRFLWSDLSHNSDLFALSLIQINCNHH